MEEALRALIEGALAAQAREEVAREQLRVAERAHSEALAQLRTEIANLDHTVANRVVMYGDHIVRVGGSVSAMGMKEVVLIPIVQVLKAAPPAKSQSPAPPPNTVPPPPPNTNPPRAGRK